MHPTDPKKEEVNTLHDEDPCQETANEKNPPDTVFKETGGVDMHHDDTFKDRNRRKIRTNHKAGTSQDLKSRASQPSVPVCTAQGGSGSFKDLMGSPQWNPHRQKWDRHLMMKVKVTVMAICHSFHLNLWYAGCTQGVHDVKNLQHGTTTWRSW